MGRSNSSITRIRSSAAETVFPIKTRRTRAFMISFNISVDLKCLSPIRLCVLQCLLHQWSSKSELYAKQEASKISHNATCSGVRVVKKEFTVNCRQRG